MGCRTLTTIAGREVKLAKKPSCRLARWSGQWVAPIHTFNVPKECSAISRRTRIACGFLSRRCCTASSTCSCCHRVMRRSAPFDRVDAAMDRQAGVHQIKRPGEQTVYRAALPRRQLWSPGAAAWAARGRRRLCGGRGPDLATKDNMGALVETEVLQDPLQ
jgi:hypothetical protein